MATRALSGFDLRQRWPASWGSSGTLVITLDRSVVSEDGVEYPATGNEGAALSVLGYHWQSAITVASSLATTSAISGLINTDSAQPDHTAKYNIYVYDARGKMRVKLNSKPFHLHESLNGGAASFTWTQWVTANEFVQHHGDLVFIADRATVQSMIDSSANVKASTSPTYGITALSTAATSASDPIAVGNNDPRVLDISNYASFAAMISAIGSTQYTFNIHGNINVTANATVPANITLRFLQGGRLTLTTGVTLIIRGPVIADPVKIFYNALAAQGTISFSANKFVQEFYAEWWGAVVNGVTDDYGSVRAMTVAMGTAGGGTWVFPIGTIAIGTTLAFLGAATENYLSIRGANPVNCKLRWIGATNGRMIDISFNKFFKVEGVGFYNGVARGTTIGVHLTGPTAAGTQTLGGVFERILIDGFNIGMLAGAFTGFATSEILYSQVYFQSNDTGWKNADLNSLDHIFEMCLIAANGIGLDVNSGNVAVRGGSASNQTTADFALSNAGTPFSVVDFRSETSNRFLTVSATSSQHQVTVKNCLISTVSNVDKIAITTTGNVQIEVAASTFVDCKVRLGLSNGTSLTMRHNFILGDTAVPFFVDTSSADALGPKYTVEGNRLYTDSSWYPDESGQYILTTRMPVWTIKKGQLLSVPYKELHRIKMLAYGSDVLGKNLRLQEKFATSATKAVTFVKTITVGTTNGSSSLTNSAGDINIADLGKKIVLTAADGSGGNVTGYISSIDSGTNFTIVVTSAVGIGVTSGAITANVGENEPDANYMLMLGCSAQEKVSWSNKATTGFTLTSDNATSTATVDIMLVR